MPLCLVPRAPSMTSFGLALLPKFSHVNPWLLNPITLVSVAPRLGLSQCPGCLPVYPVSSTKTACLQLGLLAPSSDLPLLPPSVSNVVASAPTQPLKLETRQLPQLLPRPLPMSNPYILSILSQRWVSNPPSPSVKLVPFFPVLLL